MRKGSLSDTLLTGLRDQREEFIPCSRQQLKGSGVLTTTVSMWRDLDSCKRTITRRADTKIDLSIHSRRKALMLKTRLTNQERVFTMMMNLQRCLLLMTRTTQTIKLHLIIIKLCQKIVSLKDQLNTSNSNNSNSNNRCNSRETLLSLEPSTSNTKTPWVT